MTERRRGQGDLQEGPARAGPDGQRRRPQGRRLDRRDLGARLQRLAAAARPRPRATTSARAGRSAPSRPRRRTAAYTADPSARPRQTLPGDGAEDAWKAQPPYNWAPVAAGKGLGFVIGAAGQGRRDRRAVEPRRLPEVVAAGTPTCRSRSARCGPTATRPTSRTAGCAPRTASSTGACPRRSIPFPTHLERDARAAAQGPVRARAGADLPGGPRVPRRLAHPGDDPGHRRRSPALGLRHGGQGQHAQHDRARRRARLEPGAAGGRGRHRQGHSAAGRRPRCAASPTARTRPPPTAAELSSGDRRRRDGAERGCRISRTGIRVR